MHFCLVEKLHDMSGLGSVEVQSMVLAEPILSVASFEWCSRGAPFKPLKVTSTGKMGFVPKGI